ncbi:MAG: superoxide dismutase family protein [Deltaproteobacteria bacterium]|nr:superoxide dismutase family protein [Deltaproteobacteria bacterium]
MSCLATVVAVTAACGDDGGSGGGATASATFMGTNGQTVTGTAKFTKSGSTVSLTVTITAAPVGAHGIHIHNVASCGNNGTDAGPHWDDVDTGAGGHHLPPTDGHLGDLGNITIAAGGTGTLTYSNPAWTLGDGAATDVVPRAIIFHEKMDDGTMPSAGARWGCALIAMD